MGFKRGTEIPTIDVVLVTISTADDETEIALDTANRVSLEPSVETTDRIPLIIKGRLIAQKPPKTTVTGMIITLTDNVFNPQLVKILQGGTIVYDTNDSSKVVGYIPPVSGSDDKGEVFILRTYSAIYGEDALLKGYERIEYPNCQGVPVAFGAEDGTFRAIEYTINSAPSHGEPPYTMHIVDSLPAVS